MPLFIPARMDFIEWSEDFPNGVLPKEPTGKRILLLALDTEYQSNHTANTNLCLCYSYAAYDLYEGTYKAGIFYPDINEEERYTIGEFTHKVLDDMDILPSQLEDYLIIYVAHFFTAEWAMFKDRSSLAPKLEYIRKSLITTTQYLKTTIFDETGNTVHLWASFRDTMLLLPEGYKSLEMASTFIDGFEKLDIAEHDKGQMYQFSQDNPELFEAYAIRDAEVTISAQQYKWYRLEFVLHPR